MTYIMISCLKNQAKMKKNLDVFLPKMGLDTLQDFSKTFGACDPVHYLFRRGLDTGQQPSETVTIDSFSGEILCLSLPRESAI